MEEDRIKKGSVFIADLNPTIGSEQNGRRPVVILSNDLLNKYNPTVLIAPFTKIIKKQTLPTHVLVNRNKFLKYDSIILLEQIRTIDKSRLLAYKGKVSEDTLNKINSGLIESENIDVLLYLKNLGVGGNYEKKQRVYSDYYNEETYR